MGGNSQRFDGVGGVLMRAAWIVLAALIGGGSASFAGASELIKVPTGQSMVPYEALWEDHLDLGKNGETWLVIRFLAPDIAKAAGKISYSDATVDLEFLCNSVGLGMAALTGGGVDQIIVNLMDKPIARGERDQEVTQFMSAYRVVNGACEWE
ncbi:MAG: hypothetical protein GXP05_13190 [Alphaproteobacteria bacterium]|nr:hypothetical protein [Alphaproteobacteria bacterium]